MTILKKLNVDFKYLKIYSKMNKQLLLNYIFLYMVSIIIYINLIIILHITDNYIMIEEIFDIHDVLLLFDYFHNIKILKLKNG